LKQTILYQIGLIDDPWIDHEEFVIDGLYSEDSEDEKDVLKLKRSESFHGWLESKFRERE